MWFISSCWEGKWDCVTIDCKDAIKCPHNQIYSKNASTCPKSCGNKEHYVNCGVSLEGCICPKGKILDHNVKY